MGGIERFEGVHTGERVFIVATGPSLRQTELDLLADEVSVGVNRIDKIYSETAWRPSYYVLLDSHVPANMPSLARHLDEQIVSFVRRAPSVAEVDPARERWLYRFDECETARDAGESDASTDAADRWVAEDVSRCIINHGNVIAIAMQLVLYMGVDEVYFVGTDLYPTRELHMLSQRGADPSRAGIRRVGNLRRAAEFVRSSAHPLHTGVNLTAYTVAYMLQRWLGQSGHFTDEYQSRRYFAEYKNALLIEKHRRFRQVCERRGIGVFNASAGGELEVYPRVELADVVGGC
jgi:hypothetical protein